MSYEIITWEGDSLPSKKNSKRICRSGNRTILLSQENYIQWEKIFVDEIKSLNFTIGKCKSMNVVFFAKDKRGFDLSNKFESIADGLVKAGFLDDDSIKEIPDVHLVFGGYSDDKKWRVVMEFNY